MLWLKTYFLCKFQANSSLTSLPENYRIVYEHLSKTAFSAICSGGEYPKKWGEHAKFWGEIYVRSRSMRILILLTAINAWFVHILPGQVVSLLPPPYAPDSTGAMQEIAFAETLYKEATALSQYLYNGGRYHVYDPKAETHQFFLNRDLQEGYLRYENRDYGPVQMYYDTHWGCIVIRQPVNGYLIQLQSPKVQAFRVAGHSFVRISGHPYLKEGFYDQLYTGDTPVLCARKKLRTEEIINMKVTTIFHEKDRYYLQLQDTFYEVGSKRKLLELLIAHKPAIRRYLRKNEITFRLQKEQAVLEAVQLYDRLNAQL